MKKSYTESTFCNTREISFYEDTLIVTSIDTTEYIALRPIVDVLRLDWSTQYHRIQRNEIFSSEVKSLLITDANGKQRKMLFLPIDFLSGWLFSIRSDKIPPESIDKLILYRRECFTFLWQEFQIEMLLEDIGSSCSSIAVLEQIRQTGLTIAHDVEQQIQKEQHLNAYLDRTIEDIQQRLEVVERKLTSQVLIPNE